MMKRFGLVSIVVCLVAVYSNSFSSSWHFDDVFNILENPNVTISEFSLSSIVGSMNGLGSTINFHRPVSYLTFAINWGIGGDNVVGYHIVNLLLHIACAWVLLSCIFRLVCIVDPRGVLSLHWQIALFSAFLWAIHPIHVQAVTYIVQRMTLLSALFYMIAFLEYVKIRGDGRWGKVSEWAFICMMAILSVVSKQNGILVIGSFFLVELVFFSDGYSEKNRCRFIGILAGLCFVGLVAVICLFQAGYFSYEARSFSLYERLLTQSRVFWFYLSLIFFPIVENYSIVHDYTLSTGIFYPLSTFFSLVGILGIIMFSWHFRYKYKLFVFGALFFILNHLVESSFIPLEMIFEHRNYLPSMFLFVPIGVGLVSYLHKASRSMKVVTVVVGSLCLLGFGMGTYGRNFDWVDQETLWGSALTHAHGSARPHQNFAIARLESATISDEEYYEVLDMAEAMHDDTAIRGVYVSIANKIRILERMGRYEEALAEALRLKELKADNMISKDKVLSIITNLRMSLGMYDDVLTSFSCKEICDALTEAPSPDMVTYSSWVGSALVKRKRYDDAISIALCLLRAGGNESYAYPLLSSAFLMKGDKKLSDHYLRLANQKTPDVMLHDITRLEWIKRFGSESEIERYAKSIILNYGIKHLLDTDAGTTLKLYPIPEGYSLIQALDKACPGVIFQRFME